MAVELETEEESESGSMMDNHHHCQPPRVEIARLEIKLKLFYN
jgi:hypothetical protein